MNQPVFHGKSPAGVFFRGSGFAILDTCPGSEKAFCRCTSTHTHTHTVGGSEIRRAIPTWDVKKTVVK